ncbi:thiamine diphosphokinase [Bifidobacterium aemilianum]|uniref:Thiamine diphosphokinase n=1 Tax=Bifidobacterium aemilianum TaxID=2493120 RepID=A0A366KB06_9BIFI|nr:thiamine diphosphokinase [Bifidobacterium aemilianum]RBP98303.1 thiamine diphosphokinase [Bifidobacterium aemilianum]
MTGSTIPPHHQCLVFASGCYYPSMPDLDALTQNSLIIAADGGMDQALRYDIHPDMVVGDFDSISQQPGADGKERVVRLPAHKDDSDLLSALKLGWSQGARRFHILGGMGGRLDHSLANIQILALLAQEGGSGFLYGDGYVLTALHNGRLDFPANHVGPRRMLGVFSHADQSKGVSVRGLKYQLEGVNLPSTSPLGVSNEFLPGQPSSIEVREGTLLVSYPMEAPQPLVSHPQLIEGGLGLLEPQVSEFLARGKN